MTAHPKAEILREIADEIDRSGIHYWKHFQRFIISTGGWRDARGHVDLFDAIRLDETVRRKPRTVRIGDYDVPLAVREPLTKGQEYCVAGPDLIEYYARIVWHGDKRDYMRLERGLIHLEADAAFSHGTALASLMPGADV